MKYMIIFSVIFIFLTGCKSTQELKPVSQISPSTAKEGSLANPKLISDATAGIQKLTDSQIKSSEILKFVIQQPVGEVGFRSWREMWIVKSQGDDNQFLITFKEAGLDAADFEIKVMNKSASNTNCPTSVSDFKQGQSNLFIKECLGEPDYIDQNPDGRYVYLYNRPNGVVVTYLFSPENQFTKFTAYQDKNKI